MNTPLDQLKQKTIAEFREKFCCTGTTKKCPAPHEIMLESCDIAAYEAFLTQAIEEAWGAGKKHADEKALVTLKLVLNAIGALEAEQPLPPDHAYCLSRGFDVCEHSPVPPTAR